MAAERTVDAYVAAPPAGQREIAEAVRRLVRSAAPEAREAFKWAQPVFESGGPFAYIKAFPRHMNVGVWRGVEVDGGRGRQGRLYLASHQASAHYVDRFSRGDMPLGLSCHWPLHSPTNSIAHHANALTLPDAP